MGETGPDLVTTLSNVQCSCDTGHGGAFRGLRAGVGVAPD